MLDPSEFTHNIASVGCSYEIGNTHLYRLKFSAPVPGTRQITINEMVKENETKKMFPVELGEAICLVTLATVWLKNVDHSRKLPSIARKEPGSIGDVN